MDGSERASQRERECFSLPLATVGGVWLQPVVFSLTHSHTYTSYALIQPACLSAHRTPWCLFDIFFFTNASFRVFLGDESSLSRIRKKGCHAKKAAREKRRRHKREAEYLASGEKRRMEPLSAHGLPRLSWIDTLYSSMYLSIHLFTHLHSSLPLYLCAQLYLKPFYPAPASPPLHPLPVCITATARCAQCEDLRHFERTPN